MARSIRRQSTHARLALGLAGLGCLFACLFLLFGFHADASLDADIPVVADATIEEPSEPESNTPYVPDPHTSQTHAIERAMEQLASLRNDPDFLVSSDPIVFDDVLLGSSIDGLHEIALHELLTSCVSCPELLPTGDPEQLFAYGGPMGVPWVFGGGSRSSSGGSGGGAVGGGAGAGGSGGGGSAAGAGQQASAASSQNGGSQSSGSTGSNTPHEDRGPESNGRSNGQNGNPNNNHGNHSTGGDDPENTWLPPGDGGGHVETTVSNNQPVSVPEPSVLVLTLIGLGSLAGTRRVARRVR